MLVPRETPFSAIHLENMLRLSRVRRTVILPPDPGFYHHPQNVGDLVDFVVARIDQVAVPHSLMQRWGDPAEVRLELAGLPAQGSTVGVHIARKGTPEIPLFRSAAYSAGRRPLAQGFEQRYLDMAAACMKNHTPFGLPDRQRQGVGEPAIPHDVGTLAHIDVGDMPQLGILMLSVHGGRRFHILSKTTQPDGLLRAGSNCSMNNRGGQFRAQQGMCRCSRKWSATWGEKCPNHEFDDAAWVGYRLTEIVRCKCWPSEALELDDPVSHRVLFTYLAQLSW